jgi:hypothetical protein
MADKGTRINQQEATEKMNEYVKPEQAAHYLYRELKSAITGEG